MAFSATPGTAAAKPGNLVAAFQPLPTETLVFTAVLGGQNSALASLVLAYLSVAEFTLLPARVVMSLP